MCHTAAKKPSDAVPKPKKAPAPKAKKPDKSIWDSDSDTGSKKPGPALKGKTRRSLFRAAPGRCTWIHPASVSLCPAAAAGKGRGKKRKGSGSDDEFSPIKKAAKPVGRVSIG